MNQTVPLKKEDLSMLVGVSSGKEEKKPESTAKNSNE